MMIRSSWHWLAIVSLVVSMSGANAAEPGAPPQFKFSGKQNTRASTACERAVLANLNGKATTGDVTQACTCVGRVYDGAGSSIPSDLFEKYFWSKHGGAEVINPAGISTVANAELVDGKVKVVADVIAWDVRSCLGTLPTRGQITGEYPNRWRDQPDTRFEYGGPIVPPVAGPASPVDRNLGGLQFVKLVYLREAIEDYTTFRSQDSPEDKYAARDQALRFVEPFGDPHTDFVVIACKYRTEAKNGYNRWQSTHAYYYWYAPDWNPRATKLVNAAPAGSFFGKIGAARGDCPIREPKS